MTALMKGHKWRDHKAKMTYPAWVEIKHDEIRCHVTVLPQGDEWPVTFLSFAGKPLANMEMFASAFRALAHDTGVFEFDCGFEVNKSYNDSYRWVRSTKGLPDDLRTEGILCVFLLFDLPDHTGDFSNRMSERHNVAVAAFDGLGLNMAVPHGEWARSAEDVDAMFTSARAKGYEGLMVKSLGHTYQRGKRTYGWLKVKPEDDADGIIEELHEAISEDGTPLGRAGSVGIRVEDGSKATPHGIPHDLGKDMWDNPAKYIGQWAEFKFMERDRQGGYRHPTFHRIREAKA